MPNIGLVGWNEMCDCGAGADPCCDCSTCTLLPGNECSDAVGSCCSSCMLAAAGDPCRDAVDECDLSETCTGDSPICPYDEGVIWGTPCGVSPDVEVPSRGASNLKQTCWANRCGKNIDDMCAERLEGSTEAYEGSSTEGAFTSGSACDGLYCYQCCL